jgi:deoxyribonuclease IV
MILGVHVSTQGKLYNACATAAELGCNTMQIFARNPQQWRKGKRPPDDIEEFKKQCEQNHISPVFVHIPYLINLASYKPQLYYGSIRAFIDDMREAQALGVDYIVSHMGSYKNSTESEGLKRLIKGLDKILEKTANLKVGILLENTAGSGSWLGAKFSHQKKILQSLKVSDRVGLCIDTAHSYLAGYNIATAKGLDKMLINIERLVGLERVKLIHLNDAKDKLNSRHDVHEHIGKGRIGLEGIERIINHPGLREKPFVLETPKDSPDADKINLETVRQLRRE